MPRVHLTPAPRDPVATDHVAVWYTHHRAHQTNESSAYGVLGV